MLFYGWTKASKEVLHLNARRDLRAHADKKGETVYGKVENNYYGK